MSTLFISHASADAAAARELAARLDEWGYRSLFLDFDAERGIHAGAEWEEQLYRQLKLARALVAVVSASFLESHWCFAEVTQARALGKPVFPLRIEPCEVGSLLEDRQIVDLTAGADAAWDRLRRGLEEVLGGDLPFDRERPYPGLAAFEARDAGVFFGREEEQGAVIEALERMSRRGEPRLAVVLGASGCGKSSLVKAGVLPRLARDRRRWLVLPPMRPGGHPELALARGFAAAFAEAGAPRSWRELAAALADETSSGHPWLALAEDLREAAGERQARVLLAIDQLEELLASAESGEEARLAAFRALLRSALEARDGPLLAVATLRSDFLGVFQLAPELRDLAFEDLPLGPLPAGRMDRVIVGPAERAGVEVEDELVRRLVAETGTADALPLLAFTLRELWEHRRDDLISLDLYEGRLGSIEGAVAQIAEGVAGEADEGELAALRSAFLRMARVDDEGRFVRRRARWEEMPEEAGPLLERLVDDHLLVSDTVDGERWIEVTHERIFRAWRRLAEWLAQEQELLLFRQRLGGARAEWRRLDEDPSALLDGAALAEAERWSAERRADLDRDELAFVDESLARRDRLAAAARRRRRVVLAGLSAGFAVALILASVAGFQWRRAERERRAAVARQLATVARSYGTETARELVPRLLLATESLASSWTHDGYGAWASAAAGLLRQPERRIEVRGRVTGMAVHPTRSWVAVADDGEGIRVLAIPGGEVVTELEHAQAADALAFSPDGRWLAAARGHPITVWTTADWTVARQIEGFGHTDDLAFSPDGEWLAAAQREVLLGPVSTRTWRVTKRPDPEDCPSYCLSAAFSLDGTTLAVAGHGTLTLHRRAGESAGFPDSEQVEVPRAFQDSIWKLIARPDGGLEVWSDRGLGRWSPDEGWASLSYAASGPSVGARSSDSRWLALPESSHAILLHSFEPAAGDPPLRPDQASVLGRWALGGELTAVEFGPDRRWLIVGERDLAFFDLGEVAHFGATYRLGSAAANGVAYSPDGSWLAACREHEELQIFDAGSRRLATSLALPCSSLGFAGSDQLVVPLVRDQGARLARREGDTWREAGAIPELPYGAIVSPSPDGRWIAVRWPYEAELRSRRLVRPSRTAVLDATSGEEVAWRTHEREDIDAFFEEASKVHFGLKREGILVSWEADTDEASPRAGDRPTLGEGGRLELLDLSAAWPAAAFERRDVDAGGRWQIGDGGRDLDTLREPSSGREIVTLVDGAVGEADFSPDSGNGSEWLALATRDGVALWRLGPVEALVEETCARLPRNLADREWPLDGPVPVTCPGF